MELLLKTLEPFCGAVRWGEPVICDIVVDEILAGHPGYLSSAIFSAAFDTSTYPSLVKLYKISEYHN